MCFGLFLFVKAYDVDRLSLENGNKITRASLFFVLKKVLLFSETYYDGDGMTAQWLELSHHSKKAARLSLGQWPF